MTVKARYYFRLLKKNLLSFLALLSVVTFLISFSFYKNYSYKSRAEKNTGTAQIVGGHDAQYEDWPFFVNLVDAHQFNPSKYVEGNPDIPLLKNILVCGGSFIGDGWIITAAHCIETIDKRYFFIVLETPSLTMNSEITPNLLIKVEPKNVFIHPLYIKDSSVPAYDIALIKIKSPSTVETISLPNTYFDTEHELNTGVITVGRGIGKVQSVPIIKDILQEVPLLTTLFSQANNKQNWGGQFPNTAIPVFVGGSGASHCWGDSGGPLVAYLENKRVLIGISSFADGDCLNAKKQGGFTNVSLFTVRDDWIQRVSGIFPMTGSFTGKLIDTSYLLDELRQTDR